MHKGVVTHAARPRCPGDRYCWISPSLPRWSSVPALQKPGQDFSLGLACSFLYFHFPWLLGLCVHYHTGPTPVKDTSPRREPASSPWEFVGMVALAVLPSLCVSWHPANMAAAWTSERQMSPSGFKPCICFPVSLKSLVCLVALSRLLTSLLGSNQGQRLAKLGSTHP